MGLHNKSTATESVLAKILHKIGHFACGCSGKNSFQKFRKHTEKSAILKKKKKNNMKDATEPPQDGQRITLRQRRRTLCECAATPLPILYNHNPFPPLLSSMDKGSLHDITK